MQRSTASPSTTLLQNGMKERSREFTEKGSELYAKVQNMTWIVGTVPPFGYSILVSDTCVSWSNGTEKACLQKIHKVGDDFLCGFAGSVKIGFVLLDALATQLPRKQVRTPTVLARDWIPSLASRVFRAAPEPERKLGCQIIVAAVHPTENLGDAPWPRTYV